MDYEMIKRNLFSVYFIAFLISYSLFQCSPKLNDSVTSPNGSIELKIIQNGNYETGYLILFNNAAVIDTSYFGFDFKDQPSFGRQLKIVSSIKSRPDLLQPF